ncbi:MAG: TonB-dependent receptor [Pseudomonadota bacterium]
MFRSSVDVIAASTLLLATCSDAFAQQNAVGIDEIVVKGQKVERSLQETKESVSVLDQDFIQTQRLFDLRDIFNQTPNAFELSNGEDFGIRGVSASSASTGGGVGELGSLFFDGVAFTGFARRFGPKALWDIEQVEILRGPQSTNVGRNALIGAVVMTSRAPDPSEFDSAFRLEAGNFGKVGLEAMVNAPVSENAAFRFTAETFDTDGFNSNQTLGGDEFDERSNRTFRGKFLIEPNERLSLGFSAQYATTDRGQDIFRADLVDDLDSRTSSANLAAFENYDALSGSITVDYALSDVWSLQSITAYIDGEYERFDDDDEGPDGGNAFRGRTAEEQNWSQELRLSMSGEKWRGVAGLWFTGVDLDSPTTGLVNIEPALLGVPPELQPFYPAVVEVDVLIPFSSETFNAAFFTEWDYSFDNNWTASFGFRYDYEERESLSNNINSLAPGSELPDPAAAGALADMLSPGSGPFVEAGVAQVNALLQSFLVPTDNPFEDTEYNAFLPQVGATYDINDDVSVSAFYKRGYRAGGSEVSLTGEIAEYDPEFLDNFELALRSVWLDGRLVLNGNAYFGDWSDQQVANCPLGPLSCITVNAGESEIYGAELESRYTINDRASMYLSLGYSETEFTEFVDNEEDLSGNEFALSANWSGALGGTVFVTDALSFSGSVTYEGESWNDIQNTIRLDERILLNLNARYTYESLNVTLYGRNLTDELYRTTDAPGIDGFSRIVRVGAPREYGILLQVDF